ncbi:hypothetical protein WHZ77_21655 [Bradyrhizobium sp. A5]|uniref:hypothetical protein n=1 Tax=Bradyrhizobium sp. A5 TaxID=3133696 RepID=UPI003255E860
MVYISVLRSRFITLFRRARAWNEHVSRAVVRNHGGKADDLYEIFLFGSHG